MCAITYSLMYLNHISTLLSKGHSQLTSHQLHTLSSHPYQKTVQTIITKSAALPPKTLLHYFCVGVMPRSHRKRRGGVPPRRFWCERGLSVKHRHLVADNRTTTSRWRFSCDGTTWNAPELPRCYGRSAPCSSSSSPYLTWLVAHWWTTCTQSESFVFFLLCKRALNERCTLSSGMRTCEYGCDVVWSEAWIVRILSQKSEMTI